MYQCQICECLVSHGDFFKREIGIQIHLPPFFDTAKSWEIYTANF
jgi:hypothetical protein